MHVMKLQLLLHWHLILPQNWSSKKSIGREDLIESKLSCFDFVFKKSLVVCFVVILNFALNQSRKRGSIIKFQKYHFKVLLPLFFVLPDFYTHEDLGVISEMNFSYFIILFGSLGSFILCQIKEISSSFKSMYKNFFQITRKSSIEI